MIDNLGQFVRRGLAWSMAGTLVLRFGNLAVGIALARLLTPDGDIRKAKGWQSVANRIKIDQDRVGDAPRPYGGESGDVMACKCRGLSAIVFRVGS